MSVFDVDSSCPLASIGAVCRIVAPGAQSYLIVRPKERGGNVLVDSPRASSIATTSPGHDGRMQCASTEEMRTKLREAIAGAS